MRSKQEASQLAVQISMKAKQMRAAVMSGGSGAAGPGGGASSGGGIVPGQTVTIVGLVNEPALNGMEGHVLSWVPESERWMVSLTNGGRVIRARPENLRPVVSA